MKLIFKNNELELNNNLINYYTGKNKIIIESNCISEKYILLLFLPFNNKQIFFVAKKDSEIENKELYEKILKELESNSINSKDYNNNILTFEKFCNNENSTNLMKDAENNQKQRIFNEDNKYPYI